MIIDVRDRTDRSVKGGWQRRMSWQFKKAFTLVGITLGCALSTQANAAKIVKTNSSMASIFDSSAVLLMAEADEDTSVDGAAVEASESSVFDDDESPEGELSESESLETDALMPAADVFQQVYALAAQAEAMSQTAATAAQWDAVGAQWIAAIALLQSIEPESPARILAQRQLRDYLQSLQDAQQRAEQSSPRLGLPSLGSDLFDAQLAGYLSYVATVGTPDVLIVGSSRALQGIDPQALQQSLAAQGYGDLNIFNFSVNGATAQVVEFIVGELLPQPLPPIIVWGDGSRAFNEGRRDRTWERLLSSPGYQAAKRTSTQADNGLANGPANTLASSLGGSSNRPARRVTANSPLVAVPGNLDVLGFSAVSDRFNPQTYYQQVSRVEGRYDDAYVGFALNGSQADALGRLATDLRGAGTQLLFVNLPLSDSYLDNFRLYYEQQFQRFLQAQSAQNGFAVVDLLAQWARRPELFADPSHINQDGAKAIAQQLAQQPALTNALNSIRSPESALEAEQPRPTITEPRNSDRLLERLRPAQTRPVQNEPARRPPPPIPPPPGSN